MMAGVGAGSGTPPGSPPGSTANQFAYVINSGINQIQAFGSDADGALTAVGSAVATGNLPHHVDVDPRGRFVYISNHDSTFVSGYRINGDGTLAPMNAAAAASPVTGTDPTENEPHSSVLDQTGQFLYVVSGTGASTLRAYRIDTTTGLLTFIAAQSFAVGTHAHNITISPNNQFVYVASEGSGEVRAFSRNTSDGTLTVVAPVITGLTGAAAVTVDPQSKFLYATMLNSVEVFQIGSNGGLTRITGTSSFPTGNGPHSLVIHPNGQFLYTANINAASISAFRVDSSSGALTLIQTATTGGDPNYIVIHPNGKTVYTADASNATGHKVSRFTINADGTLTAAPDAATFPVGSGTNGIGTTKL